MGTKTCQNWSMAEWFDVTVIMTRLMTTLSLPRHISNSVKSIRRHVNHRQPPTNAFDVRYLQPNHMKEKQCSVLPLQHSSKVDVTSNWFYWVRYRFGEYGLFRRDLGSARHKLPRASIGHKCTYSFCHILLEERKSANMSSASVPSARAPSVSCALRSCSDLERLEVHYQPIHCTHQ